MGHGHTSLYLHATGRISYTYHQTRFLHWTPLDTHTYLHRRGSSVDAIWISFDRLQYSLV